MFDAEDAEFNDIIDEQGQLIGEDLLIQDFAAPEEQSKAQLDQIQAMIERDQKQKLNNNRNNSAINGGYSPYRASMASRNDGRPPTRPITPIKSAQAARYPHQNTASNTSQITNSMIGHQDESAFS